MNRDDATRRVMMSIATRFPRIQLPYVAPDGSKPLVVATPNENVSDVIERVKAAGGSANIALAEARRFRIFVIEGELGSESPSEDHEDINNEMSMGMLWLKTQSRKSGLYKLKGAEAKKVPVANREFAYAG
jgi:hypothetical protein